MLLPLKDIRNLCSSRIIMLEKQGHDTVGLKEKLDSIPDSYDALLKFAREINNVPMRKDFAYYEPNALDDIREARPENHCDVIPGYLNEMEIRDKVYGGVYGRMLGCILGKPFEMGWELKDIRQYLEGVIAWPLEDFVPAFSPTQKCPLRRDCIDSTRGFVRYVQEDDDINYLVLGLKVLEQFGVNFRTQDMAYMWRENIPYGWTWGPEHSRYWLFTGLWLDHDARLPEGKDWDEFAAFLNDGDELIGAMIRGDAFGLVNPGKVSLAAEMAWRDGRLTHGKTGLYAEMWVAATIAAAFHVQNPVDAIQAGIEQLPERSRYTEALKEALQWALEESDWYSVWEKIDQKWGYLGSAGTINETAAIINALVHGVDSTGYVDFEKIICTTVMQGWDTDCSAATAGCIAGVLAGYRNIPEKWLNPIKDTFYTCVATERETKISAFAERMHQVSRVVREAGERERRSL